VVVIAARRKRGGRPRPPGLDQCRARRAAGKPDAVGIRAPQPGTVTGDPACRVNAGRLQAEIRRPNAFDKIADAADGITGTRSPVKRREAPAPALRKPTAAARRQATGHAGSLPS
jgi:hypothetical protein